MIRNLVDDLRNLALIKEHVRDVEAFVSQVIENTRPIIGYGSTLSDITYIFTQCFIECGVLYFNLKSLQF